MLFCGPVWLLQYYILIRSGGIEDQAQAPDESYDHEGLCHSPQQGHKISLHRHSPEPNHLNSAIRDSRKMLSNRKLISNPMIRQGAVAVRPLPRKILAQAQIEQKPPPAPQPPGNKRPDESKLDFIMKVCQKDACAHWHARWLDRAQFPNLT